VGRKSPSGSRTRDVRLFEGARVGVNPTEIILDLGKVDSQAQPRLKDLNEGDFKNMPVKFAFRDENGDLISVATSSKVQMNDSFQWFDLAPSEMRLYDVNSARGAFRSESRDQANVKEIAIAPADNEVVVPAELPYRQTLEAAKARLLILLGYIVPQSWLSAVGFADAAYQVRELTGAVAFAEEVPAAQKSVLDQKPGMQWMFNQNESVGAGLAQTVIHPVLMESILKSGDGRAAFELLNQFTSDARTDEAPLVAFFYGGDLKADLRKLMRAKKSGLNPTERLRVESLLDFLQVEQARVGSVETAMNAYIQRHRQSRGIAVLLPGQSLLAQIHGALTLALGKTLVGRDTIALARLARVLQQASLLEKEAQDLFLQRELPGIAGKNGKWTHSAIQALLEQWIANHELVAVSA